jgi:diguanylate cyclase (GGDEF)-like protein
LEKLVGVDGLTGIANRRAFDKVLDREFAAARRTKLPVSLLMIDVDHFKHINDTKGHQAGDECLVLIANALHATLPRATDFVARYGGEEFSAILPATDSAGATEAAKRLHRSIAGLGLSHPATPTKTVTVSIGLSTFDGVSRHSPASLVKMADRALYLAKHGGRNCSEFLPLDSAGR